VLLTPRYGDRPVLSVEVRGDGEHPMLRQRRRLVALLRDLPEADWHRPSRCAGWTVQDVVSHLTSTNGFWALSIRAGLAGEPTRYLAAFDPVASPAQLVDQAQGTAVADTLADLATSVAALEDAVGELGDAGWSMLAEAPPGHLPIRLLADHALWDCWVHERDIALPLGLDPVVDADEVLTCLRYGAGLGQAFALSLGATGRGAMAIEVTDPDDRLVVVVDDDHVRVHAGPTPDVTPVVRCNAVTLVEHLSMRDVGVPAPDGVAWLTTGLAEVFDQPAVG
jgi:uncharacterized protein (TIGR03083 family)